MPTHEPPEAIAAFARRRTFARGEVIFRADDRARQLYFLARGRVVLHRHGRQGEEIVIHTAQAGEFFAEASLHSGRYHCTALATIGVELACVDAARWREALRADADLALAWTAILSAQLRRARARVERLSLKGAAERVLHLLHTEGSGSPPSVRLQGPVRELAAELGLTHEALYRTLAALARDGRIVRDGDRLVLGGPAMRA